MRDVQKNSLEHKNLVGTFARRVLAPKRVNCEHKRELVLIPKLSDLAAQPTGERNRLRRSIVQLGTQRPQRCIHECWIVEFRLNQNNVYLAKSDRFGIP